MPFFADPRVAMNIGTQIRTGVTGSSCIFTLGLSWVLASRPLLTTSYKYAVLDKRPLSNLP